MAQDCFLCNAACGDPDLPWHDRPLWLDPRGGLMVPGLGGFKPGYVMLAPLAHEPNLRRAMATHQERIGDFLNDALGFLARRLGPFTFWEHGAPIEKDSRRSSCIEHAHLQVLPEQLDLPLPPRSQIFPNLASALTEKIAIDQADGYTLLGHSNGTVAVGADIMKPQYYRREWAKLVGREHEWDYLLVENPAVTRETIKLILAGNGE